MSETPAPFPADEVQKTTIEMLELLKGYSTHAGVRGRNDTVELEMRCIEFPPIELNIRPQDLYVDEKLILNTNEIEFEDEFEPVVATVFEGEYDSLGDGCRIEDYEIVGEGPGPAEMSLWISTGA